jgi:branched-chain amino acid transport system ATP-binding protein
MALLSTHGLTAHYGQFQALFGVDIELGEGECVAIIGANGAGKTTLMRSISGVLRNTPASVRLRGEAIGALPADEVMNLLIGGQVRKGSGYWTLERIYALFPILAERRRNPGTALSGGQQQMVAIGRALMANPDVLLCDEISLGLAPVVIKDIYKAVPLIRESGASMIIVEQDIGQALKVADRVYCMIEGRVTLTGRPEELTREAIHVAYFGVQHT